MYADEANTDSPAYMMATHSAHLPSTLHTHHEPVACHQHNMHVGIATTLLVKFAACPRTIQCPPDLGPLLLFHPLPPPFSTPHSPQLPLPPYVPPRLTMSCSSQTSAPTLLRLASYGTSMPAADAVLYSRLGVRGRVCVKE